MTRSLYHEDSYLKETQAIVLDVDSTKGVKLDISIVFPESSTEMGDNGYINGVPVITQKFEDGDIWHTFVDRENAVLPEINSTINLSIDWERRISFIRRHTALHLLANLLGDIGKMPAGGQVHETECYLIMRDILSDDIIVDVVEKANQILKENRTVKTYADSERVGFRYCQIDGFSPIPCGGVHVKSLDIIGHINIVEIKTRKKKSHVYISVSE